MGEQETEKTVVPICGSLSVLFFFFSQGKLKLRKKKKKKKAGGSKNGEGQTLGKLNSLGELSCTSFVGANLAYNASNFTVLCMI